MLRRSLSTLGNFDAVTVVPHGSGRRLVTAKPIRAGEVLFRFTGMLIRRNTGDRCLQVGQGAYLTPAPAEPESPWVFLSHSFDPSVSLSHPPLEARKGPREVTPPVLTATACVPLPAAAALTIDYTFHEYVMFGDGFVCEESGRAVRGFHFLDEAAQEAALPHAMHHIRSLHGQYLFGKESRC